MGISTVTIKALVHLLLEVSLSRPRINAARQDGHQVRTIALQRKLCLLRKLGDENFLVVDRSVEVLRACRRSLVDKVCIECHAHEARAVRLQDLLYGTGLCDGRGSGVNRESPRGENERVKRFEYDTAM